MGIKRFYAYEDVKAALDRSEGQYLHLFRQVWGTTDYDWEEKEIRNGQGELVKTLRKYIGPKAPSSKAEPGHSYEKHIGMNRNQKWMQGPEARSFYANEFTAIKVTQILLNGSRGQKALGDIDAGVTTNKRIKDTIPDSFYGGSPGDNSLTVRKIEKAICCIMKLGESTLWIHTTYPSQFQATP